MGGSFKSSDFQFKREEGSGSPRVVKVETPVTNSVSNFTMPKLRKDGEGQYSATRTKYGSLATTDTGLGAKEHKDRGFNLSPLVREPLAIEEEEKRAVDERVNAAIVNLAEKAKEDARAQGHKEGLERGYTEAFQSFQKEGNERMQRIESVLQELEGSKREIFQANERLLIDLTCRISKMVLLRELKTDKEFLLRLTRDLVERIGVRENIRIRVSSEDMASMEMIREGIEKSLGSMKNLNFEPSKDVELGGCTVETEWSIIDASVETQLQGIYEGLLGADASIPAAGTAQ